MRPPVKRLTPPATFMNPLQFGPTIAMAPGGLDQPRLEGLALVAHLAEPPAATATPPHPSAAAS